MAVALAAGLWLAGRRPRPLLKTTDTDEVAALNRTQNSLVLEARRTLGDASPEDGDPHQDPQGRFWRPRSPLGERPGARLPAFERQAWLQELRRHYLAGGGQRLEAMRLARAWGHREVVPLLQKGLRDPDPRVMREAALAMEAFRGRPRANSGPKAQAVAPPRNVARTR